MALPTSVISSGGLKYKGIGEGNNSSNTLKSSSSIIKSSSNTIKSSSTVTNSSNTIKTSSNTVKNSSSTIKNSSSTVKSSSNTIRNSSSTVKSSSNTIKTGSTTIKNTNSTLQTSKENKVDYVVKEGSALEASLNNPRNGVNNMVRTINNDLTSSTTIKYGDYNNCYRTIIYITGENDSLNGSGSSVPSIIEVEKGNVSYICPVDEYNLVEVKNLSSYINKIFGMGSFMQDKLENYLGQDVLLAGTYSLGEYEVPFVNGSIKYFGELTISQNSDKSTTAQVDIDINKTIDEINKFIKENSDRITSEKSLSVNYGSVEMTGKDGNIYVGVKNKEGLKVQLNISALQKRILDLTVSKEQGLDDNKNVNTGVEFVVDLMNIDNTGKNEEEGGIQMFDSLEDSFKLGMAIAGTAIGVGAAYKFCSWGIGVIGGMIGVGEELIPSFL